MPVECRLEGHAVIVSTSEVALMYFVAPRTKQEKPGIDQIAAMPTKLTSVESLLLHRYEAKSKAYLMVVIMHDGCSISQLLFSLETRKFHQKTYTYSLQQLPYYDPLSAYYLTVFKKPMAPEEWSPLYAIVAKDTKVISLFSLSREPNQLN